MASTKLKIVHYVLIFSVLALFSKLRPETMLVGAIAIYLYQKVTS